MEAKKKVVPVSPTREMCLAARRARAEYHPQADADSPVVMWRAMLSAAPQPAASDVPHDVLAEVERLRPHYQSQTKSDIARRQMLDHFARVFASPAPPTESN